ncbi:MAG: HAD-IA family hydrolase [Candidatus Riesia sp.]|nr:HAD-IA family hydrolase [Candidatus Riesia sp.]
MIRFSIDAWNTLLIPNSNYTDARNELFAKKLNCSIDFFKEVHHQTKQQIQHDTTHLLKSYDPYDSYTLLLENLKIEDLSKISVLMHLGYMLFNKFPPIILPETTDAINKVSISHLWGISSNTNFISGRCLDPYIKSKTNNKGLNLYSDMLGYVKPDPKFFEGVKLLTPSNVTIIHIGDDINCDIEGAKNANLDFVLCDKPQNLSKILSSLI